MIGALLVAAGCGAGVPPASPGQVTALRSAQPSAEPTQRSMPVSQESTAPASSSKPTPQATPASVQDPVPPKPTGVTFAEDVRVSDDGETGDIVQTVTWRAPRTKGVKIRIFGVTDCIAQPASPSPATGGPCLVIHTPLPASVRTPLAVAAASDGRASWAWTVQSGCNPGLSYPDDGPAYYAIVLAAYNASGHSIFAIAEPGGWYQPGPDEVIC